MRAYRGRIEHLDWMSEATRAEALRKLDTYVVKVGYPDTPRENLSGRDYQEQLQGVPYGLELNVGGQQQSNGTITGGTDANRA
jgi:hypothetical protein